MLSGGTWPGANALDSLGLAALQRPPALMAPDGLVFTDGRGGAVWGSLVCLLAQHSTCEHELWSDWGFGLILFSVR